jgi:hypothetical protein
MRNRDCGRYSFYEWLDGSLEDRFIAGYNGNSGVLGDP